MLAVSGAGGLCLFCSRVKNCIFVLKLRIFVYDKKGFPKGSVTGSWWTVTAL